MEMPGTDDHEGRYLVESDVILSHSCTQAIRNLFLSSGKLKNLICGWFPHPFLNLVLIIYVFLLSPLRDCLAFCTEPVLASLANVLGQWDYLPSPVPNDIKNYKLYDVEIKYGLLQVVFISNHRVHFYAFFVICRAHKGESNKPRAMHLWWTYHLVRGKNVKTRHFNHKYLVTRTGVLQEIWYVESLPQCSGVCHISWKSARVPVPFRKIRYSLLSQYQEPLGWVWHLSVGICLLSICFKRCSAFWSVCRKMYLRQSKPLESSLI